MDLSRDSQFRAVNRRRNLVQYLVSIAGSKLTAFQAVSFEQPIPISDNSENGGIPAKRARGLRWAGDIEVKIQRPGATRSSPQSDC